jgi:prolyl oligopeptidase
MSIHGYPVAERLDLTEEIHGRLVADPYRWLEDAGDPRTLAWCAEQARWQERWRGAAASGRLRRRLAELAGAGSVSVPAWRGERRFFTRRGPGQEHPVLLTAGPDGAERVLIDPAALDPSGATTLDGWFPSREGALLAYLISEGGRELGAHGAFGVPLGRALAGPVVLLRLAARGAGRDGGAGCARGAGGVGGAGRRALRSGLWRLWWRR